MILKKNKTILTYTTLAILILILASTSTYVKAETMFNLEITNNFGEKFNFTDQQLFNMPKTTINADLYCDGAIVTSGNWTGISLSYLLTQTHATPEVNSLQFTASDGYKVNIPYEVAIQPQTIIAYEKDGSPLIEELRLVLPGANGVSWIALIDSITMSTSGANYPEGVTIGGGKIPKLLPTQPPESIEQTQPTAQPQPTTSTNSSNIETPSPTNATDTIQPTPTSQVSENQDLTLKADYAIAALVLIIILTTSISTLYLFKRHSNKSSTVCCF
jgi:DMSO/TMAO reductase YedYZ molybdopterin-dependent catalytic subunit